MSRRGISMIEILVLITIASGLLVPLLTLSGRNVEDHQDQMERTMAQGLCLDVLERFKKYKAYWPLPGAAAQPGVSDAGPPMEEMFGPVELRPGMATLFDRVYLENMVALGMEPKPRITKTPDPVRFGLFKLEVAVAWKSHKGHPREVKYVRYCYAP
jgi:type II secretory pathway pseudopilin PulG